MIPSGMTPIDAIIAGSGSGADPIGVRRISAVSSPAAFAGATSMRTGGGVIGG